MLPATDVEGGVAVLVGRRRDRVSVVVAAELERRPQLSALDAASRRTLELEVVVDDSAAAARVGRESYDDLGVGRLEVLDRLMGVVFEPRGEPESSLPSCSGVG